MSGTKLCQGLAGNKVFPVFWVTSDAKWKDQSGHCRFWGYAWVWQSNRMKHKSMFKAIHYNMLLCMCICILYIYDQISIGNGDRYTFVTLQKACRVRQWPSLECGHGIMATQSHGLVVSPLGPFRRRWCRRRHVLPFQLHFRQRSISSEQDLRSGNLTKLLLKMTIYSGFSH